MDNSDLQERIEFLKEQAVKFAQNGQDEQAMKLCFEFHQISDQVLEEDYEFILVLIRTGLHCSMWANLNSQRGDATSDFYYRQAFDIYRRIPNTAAHLNNIGSAYRDKNDYEFALQCFTDALEILRAGSNSSEEKLRNRVWEGGTLNNIGLIYHNQFRYEKALSYYTAALAIHREAGGQAEKVAVLHNIAECYQKQVNFYEEGNYSEALRYFLEALTIHREAGNHTWAIITLKSISSIHEKQNNYNEALCHYAEALTISREVRDRKEEGITLYKIGGIHEKQSAYSEALRHYIEALTISREVKDREGESIALNSIGSIHDSQGNYSEALRYYTESLAIRREMKNRRRESVSLSNIGLVYHKQGNYEKALDYYTEALTISREVQDIRGESSILGNIGSVYGSQGHYDKALLNLQVALARRRDLKDRNGVITTLNNIGLIYRSQGSYDDALRYFIDSLAILREVKNRVLESSVLNNIGIVYGNQGNYSEALRYLIDGLAILREVGNRNEESITLNSLGVIYAQMGENSQAMSSLLQAEAIMDHIIGQVFSISSESARRDYFIRKISVNLVLCLSLLVEFFKDSQPELQAVLDLVLRRKAVGAELLASQQEALFSDLYPQLQDQFLKFLDLKNKISRKNLTGSEEESLQFQQQQLTQWEQQKEQLEVELSQQIPEINLTQKLRSVDHNAVANVLPDNSVLLEFVHLSKVIFKSAATQDEKQWHPEQYAVFVLPAGKIDQIQLINLGEAALIDQMIKTFRNCITHEREESNRHGRAADPISSPLIDNGQELRAKIFDPLLPAIGNCKRLFIAPDGDLSRLPFEVFPTDDGQRLIDHYTISYLSTGRDVLRFGAPSTGEPTPPIVAADPDFDLEGNAPTSKSSPDPEEPTSADNSDRTISHSRISRDFDRGIHFGRLQGTRTEGESVAKLLGVKPWLGADVRETPLKACRSPQILHIATHGFFLENQKQDPNEDKLGTMGMMDISPEGSIGRLSAAHIENPLLRSGLALAGANTWLKSGTLPEDAEDAILTAEDVTAMDLLSTEMVVLSACETGLGEVQTGEGVFGLRRSFVLAGAKTLVMSLWKVPDKQTQELMEDFYKRILAGQPRAEALREAQLEMKKKYPNPLYWGAFICQGDPGSLKQF